MKILIKAYQYIFYKLYCFADRLNDGGDSPCQTAMSLIGVLVCANLTTIMFPVVDLIFGRWAGDKIIANTTSMAIFVVIFFIIHDHIFHKIVDCKKVVKKFKNESKRSRIIGDVLVTLYVFGTFFFLIFFAALLKIANDSGFTVVKYFGSLIR